MATITLSVVLITKNQGWNVARLIQSVFNATRGLTTPEVILVDSASTDETVAQAQRFPITVLQLAATQRLTPAAGRYVGYGHCTGEYLLFLDGDMELYPGWLDKALQLLVEDRTIAGLTGERIDLPKQAQEEDKPPLIMPPRPAVTDIPQGGGAALYRRRVLDEIGQFNPYLYSDEEPDLCLRLRYSGYRFVRIAYPIVYHYTDPTDTIPTLIGRWRRQLYLGSGQNLRYHLGSPFFWPYVRERGFGLTPGLAMGIGGALWFWALLRGKGRFFLGLNGLAGGAFLLLVLRRGGLEPALITLLKRLLFLDGTLRGLFIAPKAPATYPARFAVIQLGAPPTISTPTSERRTTP
ncbi:MAG: glycosyltransferase [Caldilinea sp. CFX5]|nr:glycosyltransferase [Caldilinea sp. CFX5]